MASLSVQGLVGNGYLINNDIVVKLTIGATTGIVSHFAIKLENLTTGVSTDVFDLVPLNSSVTLNISPMVKAIFKEPLHSTDYIGTTISNVNSNQYRITLAVHYIEDGEFESITSVFVRNMIRGGKREQSTTNFTVPIGWNLRTTDLIPVWAGYPTSKYSVNTDYFIKREVTFTDYEQMRIKTCDPIYVKFLNSLGGYSYWLFEGYTKDESNDNIGIIQGYNAIKDLGNTLDFNIQLYSKVPKRYITIMQDLISSPEIYLFRNNQPVSKAWERISSNNNKYELKPTKDVYEVKLKFKRYYSYNPSLIW
jgi:hypothetical protein